jgi:eukaryotic-like serine/threonine-protein kinase
MTVDVGTQLGPFEILSPLGAGGMGEVYRARDSRLGREVAIKVLPAAFSADEDRLRRFEQEARAAGMLNHPNILTIYDIGTHVGSPYIVAELLDGKELRAQLGHGPLRVRQALDYAQQITLGLAAAHEKGIIHRDLKPENLFITANGRVKILDFGLAKLKRQPVHAGVDSETPTALDSPTTNPGMVMGTVGYMSPEQVHGQEADHRSDIFALGLILYEMLAGRPAFEGPSPVAVMSAILRDEPPELIASNDKIPPQLERLVQRCLEKQPERRFHSAHDLGLALEVLSTTSGARWETQTPALPVAAETQAGARPPRLLNRERLVWIAATAFLLLAALPFVTAYFQRPSVTTSAVRSSILPPEKSTFNFVGLNAGPVTVSPDGRRLAFVASASEGRDLLWVRPLDALSAQQLAGTEGAFHPFWSPDSRFLGFFADGKLKKIDAAGGPPITLCDAPMGRGGTWNRDGVIVFAPNNTGVLHRVSASGGASSAVTKLNAARSEVSHRWPCFLPDGQHLLYLGRGSILSEGETAAIYVASLESQGSKLLLPANSNMAYAQGYLLFLRERALLAQPFDARRLETTGEAFPIAEQIQYIPALARGIFSVSENGVLAYQTGSATGNLQLTWFDRSGKPLSVLDDLAPLANPKLSPNGKRLAVVITDPQTGRPDIWLYEVASGIKTRFTFDPAGERDPIWSPDGSRIVFTSNRKGHFDLYQKAASGAGGEELLLESNLDKTPTSFSPDGRFLLYSAVDPKTRADLWVLPLGGDQKPFPFLQTDFTESFGQFSPDGRWIAYRSDESRGGEIYVAAFPGPGGKRQVSTAGGRQPRWRGNGKELFYLAPDDRMMAAEVSGQEATLQVGAVRPLFEARQAVTGGFVYDVTGDGQRFLINTVMEQKASSPITLVQNWIADSKR